MKELMLHEYKVIESVLEEREKNNILHTKITQKKNK
jgi:vacuolar-type H+-ATPase subunit D/Vma8